MTNWRCCHERDPERSRRRPRDEHRRNAPGRTDAPAQRRPLDGRLCPRPGRSEHAGTASLGAPVTAHFLFSNPAFAVGDAVAFPENLIIEPRRPHIRPRKLHTKPAIFPDCFTGVPDSFTFPVVKLLFSFADVRDESSESLEYRIT